MFCLLNVVVNEKVVIKIQNKYSIFVLAYSEVMAQQISENYYDPPQLYLEIPRAN